MASDAVEVAEDYRLALEDLSSNARFEISNLTVIARENTEHALAIAEVLQTHILKTAPSKKLPALYVLDSIVKNVGTPYTLYLGRNLFKTFMESYAVVDGGVRRKMEEMLKTWKEPVPGSMDTRPVFSHELVRPIENALMKVRAVSMPPQSAIPGRPRSAMPHRDTPTPPGMRGPGGPPGNYPPGNYPPQGHVGPNGYQPPYPPAQYGPPATHAPVAHAPMAHAPAPPAQASVTLDSLLGQGVLAALMARNSTTPQNPTPTQPPPYIPPPSSTSNQPLPYQPPQRSTPTQMSPYVPPPNSTPSQALPYAPPRPVEAPKPAAAAAPPPSATSLLDQLRQAGLLPAGTPATATPQPPPPPPAAAPMSMIPPNIASLLSATKAMAGLPGFPVLPGSGVNSTALRHPFRPNLLSGLYDELGPPCTQCGRRFKTDEEGRKKKTAHMDWHFRVHQRTNEAEKRGMHRSWYVDQRDWLNSREVVDSDHIPAPEEAAEQANKAAEAAKPKYIAVPEASKGINNVCPICQDKFENKWLDTAQEWVWLDTVLVGNRAYHASCHAEATRDREGTPGYRRTPEPVLGKRKADVAMSSPKVRSLKTSA